MGEDCGSWFPQRKFNWQSQNLNHFGAALDFGQNSISSYMKAVADTVTTNGALPACAFPELSPFKFAQANEPHGWVYCLPRFRQAFAPTLNPLLKEKLPTLLDDRKEVMPLKQDSECAQKRFLVFDQSGDQTTLIFSSGVMKPARCFTSWNPKEGGSYTEKNEVNENRESLNRSARPISTNDIGDNIGTDAENELHEDTEELNALLYSEEDESDYTGDDEDDEVTSTAQSPSTMTIHDKVCLTEENTEEVASSYGSVRKRKLFHGVCSGTPVPMYTAAKHSKDLIYQDDAESRCDDNLNTESAEIVSEPSNKRMRKERIRETLTMLQNIIPNTKGKDAMVVLDEAILYLKSLKHKAKSIGI